MREPNRFVPHSLLPNPKAAALKGREVSGTYDFSKPFDPFDYYFGPSNKSLHLEFANAKPTPDGVLEFVRTWGPLRSDASEDALIDEYTHRLSPAHRGQVRLRLYREPNPKFVVWVDEFLLEQVRLRTLLDLWQAVRQGNDQKIRLELQLWHAQLFSTHPWNDGYEADAITIRNLVAAGKRKQLLWVAADCIQHACIEWSGFHDNPIKPCLEYVVHKGVPSGFRFAHHVQSLIDAIYFMVYLDMSKGQALIDCAKCGKTFLARRGNQRCCTPQCTGALNARNSYKRKKLRQQSAFAERKSSVGDRSK